MSAEKSTDWLIDLLYEDEVEHEEPLEEDLSSQDSSEELERPLKLLRPEQEAELAEHRRWLATVRQSMSMAQPSAATHDAIMEAARAQLITHAEREAQAVRKPQPTRHSPEGTLWARARFGTMAQIASLATVLVVGIFFLGRFQDKMPAMSESAPAPTATTIALNDAPEAAAPQAQPEPAPEPVIAAATEEQAQAPEESLDFPSRDPNEVAHRADQQLKDSLALNEPLEKESKSRREQVMEEAERAKVGGEEAPGDAIAKTAEVDASATRSKRSTTAKGLSLDGASVQGAFESNKDKADDSFAFSGRAAEEQAPAQEPTRLAINDTAPAKTIKREAPATPTQDLDESFGPAAADQPNSKFLSPESPMANSTSGASTGVKQQERAVANVQPRPSSSAAPSLAKKQAPAKPAPSAAPSAAPRDEAAAEAEMVEDAKAKTKADAKPATPSISITEQAFRADRFKDAAAEADRFLKTGRGTPDERARALEIKAQSYERLGRGDDAYRVYEQLEREYPGYFKKKAIDRPRKRSKKKDAAKSKIDLMDSY